MQLEEANFLFAKLETHFGKLHLDLTHVFNLRVESMKSRARRKKRL